MRKFTTFQRLAMKATLGCYRTTPTTAMEIESGIQPAWLRLQTKALSAATRMQSLAPKHPIKRWIKKAKRAASSNTRITHISGFENIAVQFPLPCKRYRKSIHLLMRHGTQDLKAITQNQLHRPQNH